MEPFASVEEVQSRCDWTFSESEFGMARGALEDLSFDANAYAERNWNYQTCPPAVKSLILRATVRYMRNPDGYVSSRAGDETVSWAEAGTASRGTPQFESREIAQLRALSRKAGFASVSTYAWGTKAPVGDGYVPLATKPVPYFAKEDDGW